MRWGCRRAAVAGGVAASLVTGTAGARADEVVDPTRGRIEGDVTVAAGVGATLAPRGPRVEGEVRLRYLETTGLFATFEDGALIPSEAEPRRVVAAGIELRPLFLFRWLQGLEARRPALDLAVDSVALELGAVFQQPAGAAFWTRPGLQAGLGVELPLFARATGVWVGIHGGVRWSDSALSSGVAGNADDRSAYLSLALAWHQVVAAHLVDLGDEAPR